MRFIPLLATLYNKNTKVLLQYKTLCTTSFFIPPLPVMQETSLYFCYIQYMQRWKTLRVQKVKRVPLGFSLYKYYAHKNYRPWVIIYGVIYDKKVFMYCIPLPFGMSLNHLVIQTIKENFTPKYKSAVHKITISYNSYV